jgi:hypothetical protein
MRIPRKAIVAASVVGLAAGGSAVAMASTNHATSSTKSPKTAHDHDRAGKPAGSGLDAGTRATAESIRTAVLAAAPGIVNPIIDQAVTDGKLTAAQAATAKQELTDLQAGRRPSADALALLKDSGARAVAQSAFAAIAKQAPAIAAPVIASAVSAGTITQAQADQLTARIASAATAPGAFGGAKGSKGTKGPKPGATKGAGAGMFDPATLPVLQDVATAVLKQAPAVAGPIIDSAVTAGTITQAQGDQLKAAATDVAANGPTALAAHRDLLSTDGVRTVVGSVAQALAKQAATVGDPIVDAAVTAGTLTQAQGDALKARLAKGTAGFGAGQGGGFGGAHRSGHKHGG